MADCSKLLSNDKETLDKTQECINPKEYILRKRLLLKFPRRPNDVYITKKTNFKAQIARCRKLLDSGAHEAIYVHGLGNASDRAMKIALQLKSTYETAAGCVVFSLSANTSTVNLIDDLEPLDDDHEPATQSRRCPAIHIKLSRTRIRSQDEVSIGSGVSSALKTEPRQTGAISGPSVSNNSCFQIDNNVMDVGIMMRKPKKKPSKNV